MSTTTTSEELLPPATAAHVAFTPIKSNELRLNNSRSPPISDRHSTSHTISDPSQNQNDGIRQFEIDEAPSNAADAITDGGYGWTIVASCCAMNFIFTPFSTCWGVMQRAMLATTLDSSPSTVSWVASLFLGCLVFFGIVGARLLPRFGARNIALIGAIMFSSGVLGCGFTTNKVSGLFGSAGVVAGIGCSLLYMVTNTMPTQYFNGSLGGKLGLANGIIKMGGGVGGAVFSLAFDALNQRIGVAWTFRIYGLLSFAICVPMACLIKQREPFREAALIDIRTFRSIPYTAVFLSTAIGVFSLFVAPFYLPLFAQSVGLSSGAGAALVAGFNLSSAVGRLGIGPLCDRWGSVNSLLLTCLLGAISTLAIWSISTSIAPLAIFAVLNGVSNGAFYTATTTAVTSVVGPAQAVPALSMAITGWTGGFLMGAPIAGYILQASEGPDVKGIDSYRPAIFYAGGIMVVSSSLLAFARFKIDKDIRKRI